MSEMKGALELLEEIGSRGLSDLDFYALHAAILAERQRHAGEVAMLKEQLRRVEGERDTLAVRMDLPASQLLMVGSELCGDGKIDPNDHRDPRWTPTLQQAAKVMRELASLRSLLPDVKLCLKYCDDDDPETEGGIGELARRILAAIDEADGCSECHMPGQHKLSCSRGGSKGARLFGSPIDESDKEPTP